MEDRLTAKHQHELKAAVDAGLAAATSGTTITDDQQKAAIAAAIAEHEKALLARHTEEIASAVERGRMEQATKGKLKDSQLVKSQKRVKELENQILEWRKAGLIPEASTSTPSTSTAAAPPPGTPTATSPQNAHPTTPTSANPSAAAGTPAGGSGTLPRKPSMLSAPDHALRGGRGGARGIVRGAQRGGFNIRGAAPGRGGAPVAATPAPAAGVSIMGAAAKRNREEGDSQDDSLAKRLKPAGEATSTGGPVALRRPPPS
jgi:nucleoprotein TPR